MRSKSARLPISTVWVALGLGGLLWAKDFWTEKPYEKWNKKEAERVLNDSPWADTFTFTDQTQSVYQPTPRGAAPGDSRENQEIYRYFRVRFLTAKPIRMAFARINSILKSGDKTEGVEEEFRKFVDASFGDRIVIAVDVDSSSARYRGEMMQLMANLNVGLLQNSTYLQRKSGEKNFIAEYVSPGADGIGAKFVFPKKLNGELFVAETAGVVRFVTELSPQYRINVPFKVDKMMFAGNLEY